MLFGGFDGGYASDTWLFDGSTWTEDLTGGQPARTGAVLAPSGTGLVLFGGTSANAILSDTWLYDGSMWAQQAVSGPPGREQAVMAAP